uniref:Integrase catalytic domain-containing protein n=1 Tax=Fagus sylvatica TaxID=28930 RepID=A0A2N9G420_FAGSY
MPPKLRQRRSQREVSVHTEHSQAESAASIQGQDPPQPSPSDPNREVLPTNLMMELIQNLQQNQSELAETIKQLKEKDAGAKTLPQNEGGNQEKPHQDSGSHDKETTFVIMSDVANLLKQEREKNPKEPRLFLKKPPYPTDALVHISKFIDSMGAYISNGDLCLRVGRYGRAVLWKILPSGGEDYPRQPPHYKTRQVGKTCSATYIAFAIYPWIAMPIMKKLLQKARKIALSVKPHTEKPKEKKSQPQVLTVSTVNNKRKKSSERSFEEPPTPVPCTLEEMMAILNKWVADGIIKLPETLRRKFHEKIQDGTLELPQAKQKIHIDPFLKHKDRVVVSVVIHGNASDVDMDESAAASIAMTPTAIKTLQRNPRFRSLFNQLGLNPEARTAATEAIMAIAADSGAHCFTAETHASRAFLETTNAITFTDEDMEVHIIQAEEISQKKIQGAPMEIKGFGGVGEYTKGHIQLVLKTLAAQAPAHPFHLSPMCKREAQRKAYPNSRQLHAFDQSESHFIEAALYDEVALTGEASLAKPIGIPLPKWEEIKDAPEADLRDLLERKRKHRAEANTSKNAADPKISAKEELGHPRWLSNIVPVKKKNGQIRCCVDFRNLNKACPKDEFPLPNMDLLIDSAAGHAMFSFMDGFSGYNQIFMSPKDAEKTAFHTPIRNFHYTVMPFGLKNARATYQRTMTAMFHDMMHREIEDYVDDIVVKSKTRGDHFGILRFDGSSTTASTGVGIVLYKGDGEAVTKSFKFDFPCSNNAAEYEAYLAGLAIAYEMGIKHLRVIGDSNLVPITELLKKEFEEPSPDQEDWRVPIKAKLMSPTVIADLREIKDYTLISGDLYRRLPGGVLAQCINLEEAKEKLLEVHEKTYEDGRALISDNGTPFINKDVREVLEHYRVKYRYSTPYYPQGNGQAEVTNRMLLRILSKMVFDYGNDWKAHLADVLWAYRSSPKTATGFTPFSLVYGTGTISPTELVVPSLRVMQGSELEVDANMCAEAQMADLEGLDEARDLAKGQMVLKAVEFVRRNLPSPSKFSPNWDGPYIIREAHGSGYYKLFKSDGTTLADPINGK